MRSWVALVGLLAAGAWAGVEIDFTSGGPVATQTKEEGASPAPKETMVDAMVIVPVVDLRRRPSAGPFLQRPPYPQDEDQESQLFFGERVMVVGVQEGWSRVEAIEQAEFTHAGHWQGYPGWVPSGALLVSPRDFFPSAVISSRYAKVYVEKQNALPFVEMPMGARLGVVYTKKGWVRVQGPKGNVGWVKEGDIRLDRDLPSGETLRGEVVSSARRFLGDVYRWGGRSGHRRSDRGPTGLDCSGFVNVVYRSVGLNAPRDAHEQYMAAHALDKASDLRPGDLVFLSTAAPDRMGHVMLFEKSESLIEASPDSGKVRRVTFKKRLGRSKLKWRSGDAVDGRVVRFATFIGPGS